MTELFDVAVSVADRAGIGEQVEAIVARSTGTRVQAYEGEVEQFTAAESFGVGIRVVRDQRQGFAHAGTLEPEAVDEALAEARDNATFGEPDEHYGLAVPDGVPPPDLSPAGIWRPGLAGFPTSEKIALAIELERRTRAADDRISGVRAASYGDHAGEAAVATSTGVSATGRATSASLGVSALATDGDETQIGGGSHFAREPAELDLDEAAADAADRATRLLGAVQPDSGQVTIVLEPRLAATFLGIVGGTLTGERLAKGRTPFADRVGEQIAASAVVLVDDPTDPLSYGADDHDGEGLATRRNPLIGGGGILRGFLHNSYSARRAGTTSTGSAVRGYRSTPGVGAQALALAPGEHSQEALIAGIDDGLYVASFTGLHSGVNPVSGDFSVGADGLAIRGGALAEPVREITLASTLQRLLLDVVAVGDDLEHRPSGTSTPTLVIDGVTMSGR